MSSHPWMLHFVRMAPAAMPRRAQIGRLQQARPFRSLSRVTHGDGSGLQAIAIVSNPGIPPASCLSLGRTRAEKALGRPRQAAKRVSYGRGIPHLRTTTPRRFRTHGSQPTPKRWSA
ncbi:hypothetical protein SPW_2581 [Streptomyces sp. W007]|nr:hypothetical protein SPW_2581 [Streptomyces sp. W007]